MGIHGADGARFLDRDICYREKLYAKWGLEVLVGFARADWRRLEPMSVEEMMKGHGFRLSASCSGQACYSKFVDHQGKRAYVTVTDEDGEGLPSTLADPVLVGIYEMRSGDEIEPCQKVNSLESYLESLEE